MTDPDGPSPDIGTSPSRLHDPRLRFELQRALIWVGVVGGVALLVTFARPLLVIFGAMVFASMLDGGSRLLKRVLPIGRMGRLGMVLGLAGAFFAWLVWFAGSTMTADAALLPSILEAQFMRLVEWAQARGIPVTDLQIQDYMGGLTGSLSTLTTALTGLLGGVTTALIIVIIGIYVAAEPRLYERGVAWLMPRESRDGFYVTASRMAHTLRRLMAGRLVGMVVEGIFTYIMLAVVAPLVGIGVVPMAGLLAILTGLLAFIPNLGALISGLLMVLVGFSVSTEMGVYVIAVYLFVQNFDGYVVVPMIARKTVDLAPALVLAAQLIMGLLFGILGLLLADPLLAMLKVALERRAEGNDAARNSQPAEG